MTDKFSRYFRMIFSKFETIVAHRHWKDEYKMETEHKNRRKTDFSFNVSS